MLEIVIVLVVLLSLYWIYYVNKEHLITEQAYALTSRGLSLPSQNGSYLGGLYVLNAAENANSVSDVIPSF